MQEFAQVCEKLGIALDVKSLLAEFDYVDSDDSNFITRDEFKDFVDSWVTDVSRP